MVAYRKSWRREYVDCHDHNQQLLSIPLDWTDAAQPDPFIVLAAGRAYFRFEDLLALAELIERLNGWFSAGGQVAVAGMSVKQIMP